MPPMIKLSPEPLLHWHQLLNFLKRLWIIGDKLWKLGIRQVSFLRTFFRRLVMICRRFMSKACRNRSSTPYDKADHHTHGVIDNVDCFRKLPISLFGGWQRSQSLPLHHEENYYPLAGPQTHSSTSQAVIPYSTTPMSTLGRSTCSSTTTRADDCNGDPPGLSNEVSDFVGVTTAEFERSSYERNFTPYVLTTDHQL